MTVALRVYGVDMTRRIEAYEAAGRPAREAYEAVERPAREAYEAAKRSAYEAYEAAKRSAYEAYRTVERSAWEAYRTVERSAWEAHEAVLRPAWEALACGDPLVDWVVMNCAAHKREALMILRALPADLDTLDDIATDAGWCSAWENLRDEAIREGVISR